MSENKAPKDIKPARRGQASSAWTTVAARPAPNDTRTLASPDTLPSALRPMGQLTAMPHWFLIGLFLTVSTTTAGVAQVLWLRAPVSRRFEQPVDFGFKVRGRRLFGENKTLRGFVVMVPATALAFCAWSSVWSGLWPLSRLGFAGLGLVAGLGFMLGELPNSALKRQLDVPPGQAPRHPLWKLLSALLDRVDSLLGSLLSMQLFVSVPARSWLLCLLLGPAIHALFSLALYRLGVKGRAG